jgi:uroporphyrin-III C-methyltransferase
MTLAIDIDTDTSPQPSGSGNSAGGVSGVSGVNVLVPSRRTLMTWLIALVAVLALIISLVLWQKVSALQEHLARQSAEVQNQSIEARVMAKQALALAQEASGRFAVFESRLSEVTLQRAQLEELMQNLSRSADENLVVDIESALRLAQQQAQLTGSIEPLLSALKSAAQRLKRSAQPRLAILERAMARDTERIKSTAFSDTPSLLVKLDELVRLSDELVLANAVATAKPTPATAPASATATHSGAVSEVAWWQRLVSMLAAQARALVRVSQIDAPEAALLSPDQSFFLRENFKLKLLNARLGVLSRQITSAQADLKSAEVSLRKYFDSQSRKTQIALDVLQQVQVQMRYLQIPQMDETLTALTALTTVAAGH